MSVLSNIKKLKEDLLSYSEESQQEILQWEGQYKRAAITTKLGENDAVKMIIDRATNEIEKINSVLLDDEDLTTEDRKVLMRDKKRWKWFLGLFSAAEQTIEQVDKKIKEELENDD